MRYISRTVETYLRDAFSHYPVVVVTGARQTGKTTLIRHVFPETRVVTFDPVVDIGNARADPDFFLDNLEFPVFLDEIQYAPELLPAIKRKVDAIGSDSLFILSGSRNFAVMKGVSESLAGRAAIIELPPLSRRETLGLDSGDAFFARYVLNREDALSAVVPPPAGISGDGVYRWIWRGGYPKTTELPDGMIYGYWDSYFKTHVERDIRGLADIGSLQTFGRFFSLLGALTSQEINAAQLGRELGIDRKTANRWLEVAESAYQWRTIPAYTRNAVKRACGKRKGLFADAGFACYLQRIASTEALPNHPLAGALFESYVANEILKSFQAAPCRPNVFHYRASSGAEIDLVLEIDGTLFPIEIKMKSRPNKYDARGFAAFKKAFPNERTRGGVIVCGVDAPTRITEDVVAIPWRSI